jgi:AAA family ATP:ADP antiporter
VLDVLGRTLRDGGPGDRAAIATALGHRTAPSPAHDLIASLAVDPDPEVRRAALRSAGRVGRAEHVELLLEALGDAAVERAAREGLIELGEGVIPRLTDALLDSKESIERRRRIPPVLGAFPIPAAVEALFRCRDRGDLPLTYAILRACNVIRRADPAIPFPENRVREDLEYEFRMNLFLTVHYRECPMTTSHAERFLCQVLDERFDRSLDRVFRRLALLYPPRTFHAAYRGLLSRRDEVRGSALEYVETTLALEDRPVVLPLLADTADDERVRLAEERYGFRYSGYVPSLDALLGSDDPWLQTCVLYVVGRRGERSLAPRVESLLEARDPRVRETAAWTRRALGSGPAS